MQMEDRQTSAKEYERSYAREVLGLVDGEKEEDLDEKLIAEAKKLGLQVPAKQSVEEDNKRPASMPILPSDLPPRRSSVDSRASMATSMVSTASSLPQSGNGISSSRASLSFRDYDSFLARGRPEGRTSTSFSPPKTPSGSTSNFSLPLSSPESSPKKHYRLLRGLSMLKLNRVDSVNSTRRCPHCPRDAVSQRRAVHKLPCGHRLCTHALRETIMGALSSEGGAIPSCCGTPIPGCLVEYVMTQQEQNMLLDKLEQWSQAGSAAASFKSEASEPAAMQQPRPPAATTRKISNESKVDSVAPSSKQEPQIGLTHPQLETLRKEQNDLHHRFQTWIDLKRAQTSSTHDRWRKDMRARHEASSENLEEHHAHSMSEAEDKQVQAEAALRALHEQETRDHATALRHMEAYCAGTYVSTGEAHHRNVTEQDLAELASARRVKDGMEGRQRSAINVLRGEQARRLRLRAQRQEREVVELRRVQRREELEGERACSEEVKRLEEFIGGRWEGLAWRWEVEGKVVERGVEMGCEESLPAATDDDGHGGQVAVPEDTQALSGADLE